MADPASADADWSSRRLFNMAASLRQSVVTVAVVEIAFPVVVPEIAIIPHSPHVLRQSAAVARVERIVRYHALDAVDRLAQFMLVVAPLIEAAFKVEQFAASFIEALA